MKLKDFAAREGISVQRAAKLARDGRIVAVKVGKSWDVDPDTVLERRSRRPLSKQSKEDFFAYYRTGTLDHVTGTRRSRLAERVQEFRTSTDPAALLRDWWSDEVPEGRGGAALVRAALKGVDIQVFDAQQNEVVWTLDTPKQLSSRIADYRAIRGLTVEELAAHSAVPLSTVRALERDGTSPTGNLHAAKVVRSLKIPVYSVKSQRQKESA